MGWFTGLSVLGFIIVVSILAGLLYLLGRLIPTSKGKYDRLRKEVKKLRKDMTKYEVNIRNKNQKEWFEGLVYKFDRVAGELDLPLYREEVLEEE